jgi:hypothetical protein
MRNVYQDILVSWMVRIYKARVYSNPGSPDFYYPAFFGHSSAITLPSQGKNISFLHPKIGHFQLAT